jgi:hypothetical protein
MSKRIDISLRIPRNSKVPLLDESGYPLDNASVRFRTQMTVPAIPKPGETVQLTSSGKGFEATTVRTNWSDDLGMFVVECQYAKRSITAEEQDALVKDPEWRMVPLI